MFAQRIDTFVHACMLFTVGSSSSSTYIDELFVFEVRSGARKMAWEEERGLLAYHLR